MIADSEVARGRFDDFDAEAVEACRIGQQLPDALGSGANDIGWAGLEAFVPHGAYLTLHAATLPGRATHVPTRSCSRSCYGSTETDPNASRGAGHRRQPAASHRPQRPPAASGLGLDPDHADSV